MSDAVNANPGSDLSTRFAAGVVMIAIACVAIWSGGWWFRGLLAIGAAVMMVEWGDMNRAPRLWSWIGAALVVLPTLILPELLYPAADDNPAVLDSLLFGKAWIGFAAILGIAIVYAALSRRPSLGWGFIYVCAPAFALALLDWAWFELVFWLMLVTWSTDIFAYFAGRAIGGPKLAPRVSPNKTWAGLIGGMAGAAVIGALAAWLLDLGPSYYVVGAPLALLAQLGDLYESWVKRRAGVKDSGSLIPGHGGVLDRVDGLLPVALATFLYLVGSLSLS
ncbi:MAG: phosphatidate cytidylyltransferase [Alphaproteobacteria bacterium]|nr:phosphatidate cytidylyltransferase [Alphaproteobacteria bacterium]MDB5720072.1 phosphatidate cytidylyltransferase [Alphaproteobacteria bacterium]